MISSIAACCLLLGQLGLSAAPDYGFWEEVFGVSDVVAASGNGGLTACVNDHGRVSVCKWPSPGYYDQLTYRIRSRNEKFPGVPPSDGLKWGLRIGGETKWLCGEPWKSTQCYAAVDSTVIKTRLASSEAGLTATQYLFVCPDADVLVVHLVVEGLDAAPTIFWHADFSPCTRLIPEVPIGDWLLDGANDFAVFEAGNHGAICHFRPEGATHDDWARAREFAAQEAGPDAWRTFRQGVWIVYGSPDEILGFQCGLEGEDASAFKQADLGRLSGSRAAVGSCDSAIALRPAVKEGAYAATVLVAFGESYDQARERFMQAKGKGYERLKEEADGYWREWLRGTILPATDDESLTALIKRCLLVLATAMDRRSSAIVRAPLVQPPLALDWPRHGVWMTTALDLAGLHEPASRHTGFYAEGIRGSDLPGARAGSFPAAFYANGTAAIPSAVLDVEAPAWVLWSFWRHGLSLGPAARPTYFATIWDATLLSTEFLAGWSDVNTGLPLHSFDPSLVRDTRSPELLLTVSTGVASGLHIANALGQDRPGWSARANEMEALCLSTCLDRERQWTLRDPLSYWPADIIPAGDSRWDEYAEARLKALGDLRGYEAARSLCDIAMVWQNRPAKLALVRPHLLAAMRHALRMEEGPSLAFPDALHASLAFIGASVVSSASP